MGGIRKFQQVAAQALFLLVQPCLVEGYVLAHSGRGFPQAFKRLVIAARACLSGRFRHRVPLRAQLFHGRNRVPPILVNLEEKPMTGGQCRVVREICRILSDRGRSF